MKLFENLIGPFRKYNFVTFELRGEIPEEEERGLIPFLGGKRKLTIGVIERILTSIECADDITGVLVTISDLRIGLARANSLRRRFLALRQKGKKVFVYIENGGNIEYLAASSADYIYIPPWTTLNLIGLGAEVTFFRELLGKLGISALMKGYGEYKSAAETFTRDSMSRPHREMIESIISDLESQLEEAVSEGRGLNSGSVGSIIDRGPFIPDAALSEGLIDGLAYEEEMEDKAAEITGVKVRAVTAGIFNRVLKFKHALAALGGRGRRIAVVTDSGIITGGESTGRVGLKTMGSASVLRLLGRLSEDRAIKALVFRVSSPGGSGVASDLIRKKLARISEKIPVVISMSDVSASGGYLISLGAHKIIADPMSLTGSIGIVSGKFNLEGFYCKLGVSKELLPLGKKSLMFSSSRGFFEDEEKKLDELMRYYYGEFVRTVSEERDMSPGEAEKAAKGRVWTGRQAEALGLVDGLGGLWDAVNVAAREAGLPPDRAPWLRFYTSAPGPGISSLFRESAYLHELTELMDNVGLACSESYLAIMPFKIKVK
jgi:protease-4